MYYYAHKGDSTDNAFTTVDGVPTRTFMAFKSKKEREEMRKKIWEESGGEKNLIDCTRKFVEQFNGRDFYVDKNSLVRYTNDPLSLVEEIEEMDPRAEK